MMDGFLHYLLPTRSQSLMLDLVVCAMPLVLASLAFSVQQVRSGNITLHKRLQWFLTIVLGVVIVAFEIDMRVNGWSDGITPSGTVPTPVSLVLGIHVLCAIGTLVLWSRALWSGSKLSKQKITPTQHARNGRQAAWALVATTVTGWAFYTLAFIVVWETATR